MLSDVSIRKLLNKDIIIEPFDEDSLTPSGYDVRVGNFIFVQGYGLIELINNKYLIPPKSIVWILTKESFWLSNRIAGTLHSMVSRVAKGLLNGSATLDPGWNGGPLLITLFNMSNNTIELDENMRFVTLVFHRTSRPSCKGPRKADFLKDILMDKLSTLEKSISNDMHNQTERFVERIRPALGDTEILKKFKELINAANEPFAIKVAKNLRNQEVSRILLYLSKFLAYLAIILIGSLHIYWDEIKWIFNNIPYDSKIFVGQITLVISLVMVVVKK